MPDPKSKGGAQPVNFGPAATPAAGFVLYWAGDLLDQPRYKEAAYQTARGIASAQRPLGQYPSRPVFLPASAGGRDEVALVADRSSTRASLGFLLTLLDETGGKDEVLRRSASRALLWMIKQQANTGAWPQAYPPSTQPADAVRLARLDTPDWRDCTFVMLLARDVMQEKMTEASVRRSIDALLKMRITTRANSQPVLWSGAYGLDGFPTDRVANVPQGIDTLASRNAMQILLASYLTIGELQPEPQSGTQTGQALVDAAEAVAQLPKRAGGWVRVYDYRPENTEVPTAPSTSPFAAPQALIPQYLRTGDYGMTATLAQIDAINTNGREKLIAQLSKNLTLHQRLAAAVCGVEDDPFSIDGPTTDDQIPAHLKSHEQMFKELNAAPPRELPDRVHRIWLLIARAKLEIHGAKK